MSSEQVVVRMYNVGFGDCFLLEFPRQNQEPFRVLVDCGSHSAGHPRDGWKISDAVAAIVNDVGEGPHPSSTSWRPATVTRTM